MLMAGVCLADAPQLRVEARLEPASASVVGETVLLKVDVLTDTWFTSAPQLPVVEVDNAIVSPPSGEARHLNLARDGKAFFGLEFTYQITPTAAGDFALAPITISATPGQSSAVITVRSEALQFTVDQPAGVAAGQAVLVAKTLSVTQSISQSRDTLGVGDSVQRQITQTAEGAQMMLIPAAAFADISGLKRYVGAPGLKSLDDGRGNVTGGMRIDSASYVIERGGNFQLPAISVQWWDSSSRILRSTDLPAVTIRGNGTVTFNTPFSVREDLQRLGQHTRLTLSRHWLALFVWLSMLGVALYIGWPWCQRGVNWLQTRRADHHRAWLASPGFALKHIAGQLQATPVRFDALYLWVRREFGATGLNALHGQLPPDLTKRLYGRHPQPAAAIKALAQSAALRHPQRKFPRSPDRHGLRQLNPRISPGTTETPRIGQ